jgi:tRNA-splicing endonuclease subunit Sen34
MQPSLVELESWNKEQQALFRQQVVANESKVAKEQTRSLTEDAIRKRKEREERKRLAAQKLAKEATNDIDAFSPAPEPAAKDEPLIAQERSIPTGTYTISIPAVSDEYQWYSPQHATFSTITSAQQTGVWLYPSDLNERARYGVFRSLWEQGYFMGSGIKFGGDYLVYPGPNTSHSTQRLFFSSFFL